jgi:hypothetical protein
LHRAATEMVEVSECYPNYLRTLYMCAGAVAVAAVDRQTSQTVVGGALDYLRAQTGEGTAAREEVNLQKEQRVDRFRGFAADAADIAVVVAAAALAVVVMVAAGGPDSKAPRHAEGSWLTDVEDDQTNPQNFLKTCYCSVLSY